MDKKLNNEEIEKGVFVINQHYEIVYMDETAKQTFPGCEQHAFCYQMLQESKTPCFDCPLKKTGHQKIENRLLYNQKLEIWMEYVAIQVEWPKEGLCTLISMHAAAPGKAGSVIHAQLMGCCMLLWSFIYKGIPLPCFMRISGSSHGFHKTARCVSCYRSCVHGM